jgi:hypothetical protein
MKVRRILYTWLMIGAVMTFLGLALIATPGAANAQGCTYYMWSDYPSLFDILIGTVSAGKIWAVNGEVRVRYTGPYPQHGRNRPPPARSMGHRQQSDQ